MISRSLSYQKPHIIMGFNYPKQIKKMRWYFHEYDKDDRPSVPHAHSFEGRYKLDPWNGSVYKIINKKLVFHGKAKKIELEELHGNQAFMQFALKEIQWYQKEFPCKKPNSPIQYWMKDNNCEIVRDSNPAPVFEITVELFSLRTKRYYRRYSEWFPKR